MKEKCRVVNETVKKGMETVSINDMTGNKDDAESGKAFHNDKGAVLMKLMGWKGGGLGRDEDGRTDIVEHNQERAHITVTIEFSSAKSEFELPLIRREVVGIEDA